MLPLSIIHCVFAEDTESRTNSRDQLVQLALLSAGLNPNRVRDEEVGSKSIYKFSSLLV